MRMERLAIALTVVNLALLLFLLARAIPPVAAENDATVLRGRALEIVDAEGRTRASLNIQPPSTGPDGKAYSETVLLRLINPAGQPSVKIGASATSAGLSFVGGDDQSYVILQAEGADAELRMVEPEGRQQTIAP